MDDNQRRDAGMTQRRKVLGNEWVDKSIANRNAFNTEFQELITRYAWGDIWTRPHLSLRDRQLATLAAGIALARTSGNHSHYHSALHIGITKEEIMELILHVGQYAGWPTIGLAMRQFNKVLKAAEANKKGGKRKSVAELSKEWER